MYPLLIDWIMLALCAILVLPWLLGGLLVLRDLKDALRRRYDRRRNTSHRP